MDSFTRIKWATRMVLKTANELTNDLLDYYFSPYPFLLIIGAIRRLSRRLRSIWIPKGRGRPAVSAAITDLILDMKRSNKGWGALRISQELALLGIKVSKLTVAKILKQNGFVPPRTRMTPISWQAFFTHHKHIWAMDFHCVFDVKGNQLFVLVILDIVTRELVSINATLNPERQWIIQQFRNANMAGYGFPTGLIADNDGIYGVWLDQTLKKLFDIDVHHIPFKQPWKNGRCERFHLTIKAEIFERIDIRSVQHARELCFAYQVHYNSSRPHQALEGLVPKNKVNISFGDRCPMNFSYKKTRVIGGLITEFSLAA